MKTYLTGIKPTGLVHLGNYLGAIKPALNFIDQNTDDNHRFLYFVADAHALTTRPNPDELNQSIYSVAATWLSLGLDPKKVIFYRQSDIAEVFELAWILACYTPKGDLNRAHSYKAILQENQEQKRDPDYGVNQGLFSYPVLMASDILLFDTDYVPVGKDQLQHIEIARAIACRLNEHLNNEVLKEPQEHLASENSQYVLGLDGRKMSKSYNNTIPLFESEKALRKKIMKIKTDALPEDAPKDPDSNAIMSLFEAFASADEVKSLKERYAKGIGWGHAKQELFEAINREIAPARQKYEHLMSNPQLIDEVLDKGASEAKEIAAQTLNRVKKSLGVRS